MDQLGDGEVVQSWLLARLRLDLDPNELGLLCLSRKDNAADVVVVWAWSPVARAIAEELVVFPADRGLVEADGVDGRMRMGCLPVALLAFGAAVVHGFAACTEL